MESSKSNRKKKSYLDLIFAAVLILYPMRHICWGVDLWDTGYNYANFSYMGLEHMDPMWLFSTYLSNAVGHLFTLLPGAGCLMGMNFYTGLFVSGLAAGGYFFCTGELGIPRWIAFVGEMAAVSLCWCPTALLYNYMTYALFTGCVVLLYKGLTREKKWCLFGAGVCLGCNVLVRFSNLPEAAMIVAVWAWDLIVWRERRLDRTAEKAQAVEKAQIADVRGGRRGLPAGIRHTLWCLGGYLTAIVVLFGHIQIRYGLDSYVAGIQRLFAMTEDATDYTAKSMIMGVIGSYVENMYWGARILFIAAVGAAGFAVMGRVLSRAVSGEGDPAKQAVTGYIRWACRIGWCGVSALMLVWLYVRRFCSLEWFTYGPMERPAILFLALAMLIGVVRIFHPDSLREEKLISGMVILVILLTSIGSNNRVFPSINHMFVVAPYTLWECLRFVKIKKNRWADILFPVKAVLTAFLLLFLVQSAGFGLGFVFAEGTGVQNTTTVIDNNEILKGIRMDPERAEWLQGISGYVNGSGLQGREVILFGQIPSLSYYLQMPSAFNPWSDLRSYSFETMQGDLEEVRAELESGAGARPVIIYDKDYLLEYEAYLAGGEALLAEQGVGTNRIKWIGQTARKYQLLKGFEERYNYDLTYENEKFMVFE